MNHLRLWLLASLILLAGSGVLQAQSATLSLEQAIDFALANSPDIQDARLKVQDAEARILESRSIGMPKLNASGQYQRYLQVPLVPLPPEFTGPGGPTEVSFVQKNNLTGSVNLDALLFDASFLVALRAARAARDYAEQELQMTQRSIRQSVRDVYLPVLLLQANLEQLDKNIGNLETLRNETQEIYEAGFAEQLDVDRLSLSLANLSTEREALNRQFENAVRALKFTLNYPSEQAITLADDMEQLLSAATNDELMAQVDYTRRPELGVLDQAIVLSDYNIQNFKSGYLPSLRGFGGYQYQYQGNDFQNGFWAPTGFIGVALNIPIYDGGYKRSQIDRATISRDQVLLQRNTIQRLINLEVENARASYLSARERLDEREANLALAQRIYDTTQIKYREGVGSSLEVNQAEQALFTAQTNRLTAMYELLVTQTDLKEALGIN